MSSADPDGRRSNADAPALIRRLLRRRARPFLLSLGGAFAYLGTLLAVPLISRDAVNGIIAEHELPVVVAALTLVGLAVVRAAAGALRKYQSAKMMCQVGADLRQEIFAHLQRLDIGYHSRMGSGQLMSRVAGDVTTL